MNIDQEPALKPLTPEFPWVHFACGDMTLEYVLDGENGMVGFRMFPVETSQQRVKPRLHLESPEVLNLPAFALPMRASQGEVSLIQLKLQKDDALGGFACGRTMRLNTTAEGLRFERQEVAQGDLRLEIRTYLRGVRDFTCVHVITHEVGDEAVTVFCEFHNGGAEPLSLEMLSTFCLSHISPFDREDSSERLHVHRFRSFWSGEGRHEAVPFEDLHLERSWTGHSVVSERFGQVGSMPVRGFFPFLAIEDRETGVFWGAQLACASSWQMEIYRRDDKVSISGGLADREFGHWLKAIAPGETFSTPRAFLSTGTGDIDSFAQRLTLMQAKPLAAAPALEQDLPILFNEWCSSWGTPTPEFILATADRLRQTPVRIFVIDDGWAEKPEGMFQFNGDWNVEKKRFPKGLQPVSKRLREMGLVPGLWFEFEVCTRGTEAYAMEDHQLRLDGRTLSIGTRHFWDFTDPWTFEYLTEKVINRLKNESFGYLKVDYNDTLGIGCDHPDSPGEGLRLHVLGVQKFFRKLREELPALIIENCSSGGHRLEPSMMELVSMGSFSDAHESLDIPIIAANLHRLILPRQSQIWAVLHAKDDLHRLRYSLTACFLGRMCLSGEIVQLSDEQFHCVQEHLEFYERVKHLIRDGRSVIHREIGRTYRKPAGWQAVVRSSADECLVVAHSFAGDGDFAFSVPLPQGSWVLEEAGGEALEARMKEGQLSLSGLRPHRGSVLWLKRPVAV